jgi:cytochrome P450
MIMDVQTAPAQRSPAASAAGLPPGPSSPSLVQTYRYIRNPLPLLEDCAERFGDMFTLRLIGTGAWVFLCSPALVKTLFTAPADVVHAGEANASIFGPLSGEGTVLTMDESPHLDRRRLLLPFFHGDRMQVYFEQMRDIAGQAVDRWRPGVPFALHPHMQQMTLQVIIRTVFGVQADRSDAEDRNFVRTLTDLANNAAGSWLVLAPPLQRDLGPWSPWGRVMRIVRQADVAMQREIARRRSAADGAARHDILSLLLQTTSEEGTPLSDREVRDELVVMLMAGHETTGTALAWAFERILSVPAVEERLRAELATVIGCDTPSARHLPRLEYLDAAVKESLRTRPIVPGGGSRVVRRPFEIGGYVIPPGNTLINCIYLLHRRPDLYPEPDAFKPERFLGRRAPDPYEWTPFGGGMRRCLGMAFALFEMKTVMATVLSKVRLRIERPHVRAERRGFFLVPEGGPRVTVEERFR